MGLKFWGTWQTDQMTADRVRDATSTLIALDNGKLVATISLYPSRSDHPCEHYRIASYFGQFGVLPELPGTGLGSEMLTRIEQRAHADGSRLIALDTAEPATHLIRYYEKR